MPDTVFERHGMRVLMCAPDGPVLSGERDAVDMVGEAMGQHADLVVLPVERLDERFFTLSTRVAGEIAGKFQGYGLRVAIVGDIERHLRASSALRAFVYETNRGRQLWFLSDLAELDARLAG